MIEKYTGSITDVLRSRRFVSSVVYAIVALLTVFVPQFEGEQDTIVGFIEPIIIALIAGYTIQDIFVAIAGGLPIPSPSTDEQA